MPPGADAAAPAAESPVRLKGAVQRYGYWGYVWRRFKRDKLAVASAIFILFMLVGAFVAPPVAKSLLGHGPTEVFAGTDAIGKDLLPAGPWTWVDKETAIDRPPYYEEHRQLLVLGAANRLGQDEFLRLLYGARASLEVALLSTLGITLLAVMLGVMAGYLGGWIDGVVWRLAEVAMVFPILLFMISLSATAGPRLDKITLGGVLPPGVFKLAFIFTIFGWFYLARIVRAQTRAIREKEYVEAARMIGASDFRIMRSHVLPHLVAPIVVYSSLIVGTQILAEAGLSYLSLGIQEPTPSWGNMLASSIQYYSTRPLLVIWPGLAIMLTVIAFNLLGDGLRDAFDPASQPAAQGAPRRTRQRRAGRSIRPRLRPRVPVREAAASVVHSYRWRRRFAFAAIGLAVAGPLLWLGIRYSNSGNPENANGPTVADYAVSRHVPFTPAQQREVHSVLKTFVAAAVVRQHPGKAWGIAGPSLKDGLTQQDWAKGDLPVVPYPAANHGWGEWISVDYSYTQAKRHTVGLEVYLMPKPHSGWSAMTANVEVVNGRNGRWLVDYWMPKRFHGPPAAAKQMQAKAGAKKLRSRHVERAKAKKSQVIAEAGDKPRVAGAWWALPVVFLGVAILLPLTIGGSIWYRNRKAKRAYGESRPLSGRRS